MKKLVFIFLAVYGLVACASRKSEPIQQKMLVLNDSEKNGQHHYMYHCQKCHPNAEAGLGPAILAPPTFLKKYQVRHGLGVMPRFNENKISDEELDDIMAYLKALKKF
jgi:mono/diheme cytochrome c family protein